MNDSVENLGDRLIKLSLFAGLLIVPLFPLGILYPSIPLLASFWWAHLFAQSVALICSVTLFAVLLRGTGRLSWILAPLFILFTAVIAAQALIPITSRDALIYHLAVPKLWLETGRITDIRWNEFSYFPLLLSTVYAGFEKLGADFLTPFYHASFLFLACGVTAALTWSATKDALLSALSYLFCLSIPVCLRIAAEPMSDAALALYFGITLLLIIRWMQEPRSLLTLFAAGLALGLALSTKYTSLLATGLLPLGFIVLCGANKIDFKKSFLGLLVLGAGALISYLPWPARDYLWKGDPLYPFLAQILGTAADFPFIGKMSPLEYRAVMYQESWIDILLLPLRELFAGSDGGTRTFDGVLSPFLILALVPLLLRKRLPSATSWIGSLTLLIVAHFLIAPTLHHMLVRYHAPFLVPGVVLMTLGIAALSTFLSSRYRNAFLLTLVACHSAFSANYTATLMRETKTVEYLSGSMTKDEYLTDQIGEYPIAQYINQELPHDAAIYLLFTGNRFYYYDRDTRGAYFSATPIFSWLEQNASADEIANNFAKMGITHLAVEMSRTNRVLNKAFEENPAHGAVWQKFAIQHLHLVKNINGISLFKII